MVPNEGTELFATSISKALMIVDAALVDIFHVVAGQLAPQRPSFTQLLAPAEIDRAGSFRRAARDLALSEATLYRAVSVLESRLAMRLVSPSVTGAKLTPAGAALAGATRRAWAELDNGLTAVREVATARLTIGITSIMHARFLAHAIASFSSGDGALRFCIESSNYSELISRLALGELDLLLSPASERLPQGLVQDPVFDEVLAVVARASHPLAALCGEVTVAHLARYPWIAYPPRTPRRNTWEDMFRKHGVTPLRPLVECKRSDAMCELLHVTDSLALLSFDQFRSEREQKSLVVLGDLFPEHKRKNVITTRLSWKPDGRQAAFIQHLHQGSVQ